MVGTKLVLSCCVLCLLFVWVRREKDSEQNLCADKKEAEAANALLYQQHRSDGHLKMA